MSIFGRTQQHKELQREFSEKFRAVSNQVSQLDWGTISDTGTGKINIREIGEEWGDFVQKKMLAKTLDVSPFNGGTMMLCQVLEPFEMGEHTHESALTIMPMSTSLTDLMTGKTAGIGDSIHFEPSVVHNPRFETIGFAIFYFWPKLKVEKSQSKATMYWMS
jgi:hypothetical protein